jgi:hypothetical protein
MATQDNEGFDLPNLESKLNEPEPIINPDPSDQISNEDKPVYVKKSKKRDTFKKLEASKLTIDQISNEVKKAFDIKITNTDPSDISALLDNNKRRALYQADISQTVTSERNLYKLWIPKVKNILPLDLYGTKSISDAAIDGPTRLIIKTLERQRKLSVDQFVRNQARDIINERFQLNAHKDNLSFLSHVVANTKKTSSFLDTFVKKYMMTSIELKFKHIFVSQDILKHTKLMIETLSSKLDSVKHNTALSDVAKISAFAEFKRTLRIKANTMLADAALAQIKGPVTKLINDIVTRTKDAAVDKYQRYTGNSPIEFSGDVDEKLSDKTKRLARKVKGDIGYTDRSFLSPNMSKITDIENQTLVSKSLSSVLDIIKDNKEAKGIRTLGDKTNKKATFDELTRRSVIDIIPSLLAKIHQQVTKSSNILLFNTKRDLYNYNTDDLDAEINANEIRFDKTAEKFVNDKDLGDKLIEDTFGDRAERGQIIQPIVNKFYKGFVEHGGDKAAFERALPSIVTFITNISKHAKIVKLDHIKKYLNGADLTAFEKAYLDSIFVDIPQDLRKDVAAILTQSFFKDIDKNEIDTAISDDIGKQLRDIIKLRQSEIEKLTEFGRQGDLRNSDIVDKETGQLKHDIIRKKYANVDIEGIRSNLSTEEATEQSSLKEEMAQKVNDIKNRTSRTIRRVRKRFRGDEGLEPPPIPTRDQIQISGPGVYTQGSKEEFHIPLDKISDKIRVGIINLIGKSRIKRTKGTDEIIDLDEKDGVYQQRERINLKDKLKETKDKLPIDTIKQTIQDTLSDIGEKTKTQYDDIKGSDIDGKIRRIVRQILNNKGKAKTDEYESRVEFKGEPWRPRSQSQRYEKPTEESKDDKVLDFLKDQFETNNIIQESQLQALNAIIGKLDILGSGSSEEKEKRAKSFRSLFNPINFGKKAVGVGLKAGGLYLKGVGKFYKGLFNLSGKALKTSAGLARGGFGLGKGALGILGNIIPGIANFYGGVYKNIFKGMFATGKGVFNLGKKLFRSSNKYADVYRKDEVELGKPLLKGIDIKNGKYAYLNGGILKDSLSITEPIIDTETNQVIISEEDLEHGLVDYKNKPLKSKNLLGKIFKGIGTVAKVGVKGYGMVLKGYYSMMKTMLSGIFSFIPGIGKFFGKKKKDDPGVLDTVNVKELITNHLVKITELLQPISAHYGFIREGSYDDYKRDREAEKGSKRKRIRDIVKEKGQSRVDSVKEAAKKGGGLLGLVGAALGFGGDGDGEGGSSALGTATTLGAGGYALKKTKDVIGGIFGKKAATEGAEAAAKTTAKAAVKKGLLRKALGKVGGSKGAILAALATSLGANFLGGDDEAPKTKMGMAGDVATDIATFTAADKAKDLLLPKVLKKGGETGAQQLAKQGILRSGLTALGRFGFMQAARTAVVSGATAIAGAVSAPAVLAGLAIAGLTTGGYVAWNWSKNKDRRKSITKIRNSVYKVPEDKLNVVIDLENDLSKAMNDNKKSDLVSSKLKEYIEDFGLDPDDKRQFIFFKHWYSTIFFPVFKASYDIIEQSFKIKFIDQEKLSDDQLNEYKQSIENNGIFQSLKENQFELSSKGFRLWEKEEFFKDGEYVDSNKKHQELEDHLKKTTDLIKDNSAISKVSFEDMQKKNEAKINDAWDGYGMVGVMPEFNLPTESPSKVINEISDTERSTEEYADLSKDKSSGLVFKSNGKVNRRKTWKNVEKRIIEQMVKLGWSKAQAIGIAANIHAESSGDMTAVGDSGATYGLAQWHPPRQRLFKAKFKKDIRQATFDEQLAFIDYELRNGNALERKAGRLLKKAGSPSEAASAFTYWYERPRDKEEQAQIRSAFAASIARNYKELNEEDIRSDEDMTPEQIEAFEKSKYESDTETVNVNGIPVKIPSGGGSTLRATGSGASSPWDNFGEPSIIPSDNIPQTPSRSSVTSPNNIGKSTKGSKESDKLTDLTPSEGISATAGLGESVAKYESGKKGVMTISSGKGDPGGVSYGKYQLSSNAGTLSKYLKMSGYSDQFKGLSPGSAAFNAKWKELGSKDPKFAESQNQFIHKTHYEPAFKKAQELGFDTTNRGIQEAIWSGSIQHGGIKEILRRTAAVPGFDKMTPEQQIAAFYQQRSDYASYYMRKNGASEEQIKNASYGRYKKEIKDVIALSQAQKDDVTKQEPSIPSPVVNQPQIENDAMKDIQEKDIKAGLPKTGIPEVVKKATEETISKTSEQPKPEIPQVVKEAPKPINVTPSKTEGVTQPVVSQPLPPKVISAEAAPKTVTEPAKSENQVKSEAAIKAAYTNFMSETPEERRRRDELFNQYRKNMSSLDAARLSRENAHKEFGKPVQPAAIPNQINPGTPQTQPNSEITVNDPEGKNQTTLLQQQNELLSQIASLLGGSGKKESKEKPVESGVTDNSAVVTKLDEVISAIQANASKAVGETIPQQTGTSLTRNVEVPSNKGLSVGRQSIQ